MKQWLGTIQSALREPVQLVILIAGLLLIAVTWLGTLTAEHADKAAALARANTGLADRAVLFENQLRRRLFASDRMLRILEAEWETAPTGFDQETWLRRNKPILEPGMQAYITDEQGIARTSTQAEVVGTDLSKQKVFLQPAALPMDDGELFVALSAPDPITRQRQITLARRLDTKDGHFAGIIGISYSDEVIDALVQDANPRLHGMVALVGTRHGRIYAGVGASALVPGGSIGGSPIFAAIQANPDGFWTGKPFQQDDVRTCALRQVVSRPLAVVVCDDPAEMMAPHTAWRRMAGLFAGGITVFLLAIVAMLLRERHGARRREEKRSEGQRTLEAANASHAQARALAESHAAQLDAVLAGISDGVSVIDAEMRLAQWNPPFSEYTGVPADILRVGLPMTDILRAQANAGEFGPVDVETEVAKRFERLLAGSGMGLIERSRPNGRTLEMRRSALPQGGFVTLYTDISPRKLAERAMESAREFAETAVADKSRFVAIVSHEIRTPLNTLLNALMMLDSSDLPPSQRGALDVARQSGDALFGLLDDILEMSRADAGQLALRLNVFALHPLLESILEIFRDQAAERNITFHLEIAPGMPDTMYSDAGRLRQVLMNLVSNALKYSRPGKIVLRAMTILQSGRTSVWLGVRDCGPAIAGQDRDRLFQPFSRLEHHGSPLKSGTGLGLVICQRLMTLLGGEIGYREAQGDCNEFWITLPHRAAPLNGPGAAMAQRFATPGSTDRPPAARDVRQFLPRTRVLLVDDTIPNRTIVATLLRREGHKVDVAGSGQTAIAALRRTSFDIVLMDIFMPGMNGRDATRVLRSLGGAAAATPVLALTANIGSDELAKCVAAGMQDMISKPVDVHTLLAIIARYAWPGRRTSEPKDGDLPPAEPAATIEALEPPAVDEPRLTELRASLPPVLLADLVDQCLRDIAIRLPALQASLDAGQPVQIEEQAHAMAGMAASYAMEALKIRLRRVITAARDADVTGARAAAIGLNEDFSRTDAAFRTLFPLVSA